MFALRKKLSDFLNSKQNFFSDKLCKHFSLFNVFIWICKYFYCHCIYNSVTNIDFLCLFYFLSFQFLIFPSKIHKHRGTSFFCVFFFSGEGERVCLIGTGTKNGRRGVSSDSTFWRQKKKSFRNDIFMWI